MARLADEIVHRDGNGDYQRHSRTPIQRSSSRPGGVRIGREPLVSICITAYNHADTIGRAIDSAVSQGYGNTQVLVLDDASADQTVDRARAYLTRGVEVHVNATNLGHTRSWNRAVGLARGELVKFLHGDDTLDPECVSSMVERYVDESRLGMVFCKRRVSVDTADDPAVSAWLSQYGEPHRHIRGLSDVNDGAAIFCDWISSGTFENWVGEPSSVMVRRDCLALIGGFHRHLWVMPDIDMWMRLMAHFDVGYVDRELATFQHHTRSLTAVSKRDHRDWLDRLWLVEGLCCYPPVVDAHPVLEDMRRSELAIASRITLKHRERGWSRMSRGRALAQYLIFRAARRRKSGSVPFGSIDSDLA